MTEEPRDGVEYDVQLGETFLSSNPKTYHTLQYNFKPASLEPRGTLSKTVISESDGNIVMEFNNSLPSNATDTAPATQTKTYFQGAYKNPNACILFFDPAKGSFRIEQITSSAHGLKALRTKPIASVPTKAAPPRATAKPKNPALANLKSTVAPVVKRPKMEPREQVKVEPKIEQPKAEEPPVRPRVGGKTIPVSKPATIVQPNSGQLPSILRDDEDASSSDNDFGEALEQEMELAMEPMEEVSATNQTSWEAPAMPSILNNIATNEQESSSSDSDSDSDSSSSSSSSSSDSDSDSGPENQQQQ